MEQLVIYTEDLVSSDDDSIVEVDDLMNAAALGKGNSRIEAVVASSSSAPTQTAAIPLTVKEEPTPVKVRPSLRKARKKLRQNPLYIVRKRYRKWNCKHIRKIDFKKLILRRKAKVNLINNKSSSNILNLASASHKPNLLNSNQPNNLSNNTPEPVKMMNPERNIQTVCLDDDTDDDDDDDVDEEDDDDEEMRQAPDMKAYLEHIQHEDVEDADDEIDLDELDELDDDDLDDDDDDDNDDDDDDDDDDEGDEDNEANEMENRIREAKRQQTLKIEAMIMENRIKQQLLTRQNSGHEAKTLEAETNEPAKEGAATAKVELGENMSFEQHCVKQKDDRDEALKEDVEQHHVAAEMVSGEQDKPKPEPEMQEAPKPEVEQHKPAQLEVPPRETTIQDAEVNKSDSQTVDGSRKDVDSKDKIPSIENPKIPMQVFPNHSPAIKPFMRQMPKKTEEVISFNHVPQPERSTATPIMVDLPKSYSPMDLSSGSRSPSPPMTSRAATTKRRYYQNKRKRMSSPEPMSDSAFVQESKRIDREIRKSARFYKAINDLYPRHNEAADSYVRASKNVADRIQENVKRLMSDVEAINELLQVKEFEWNKLLHLKKVKEELLTRLMRRKHVIDMVTNPKTFERYDVAELREIENFLSNNCPNVEKRRSLTTVEQVMETRANMSREELEKESENNERLQKLINAQFSNKDIFKADIVEELRAVKELHLPQASGSSAIANSIQLSTEQHQHQRQQQHQHQHQNPHQRQQQQQHQQEQRQYSDNEEQVNIGRRGPFRNVKSLIADFRQKNPETMPRVGKRIKTQESSGVAMKSFKRSTHSHLNKSNVAEHDLAFEEASRAAVGSIDETISKLEELLNCSRAKNLTTTSNQNVPKNFHLLNNIAEELSNEVSITPISNGGGGGRYRGTERQPSALIRSSSPTSNAVGGETTPPMAPREPTALASAVAAVAAEAYANGRIPRRVVLSKDIVPTCQQCRKNEARFLCAGCGNQWYCSRSCQISAWDDHSEQCDG